MKEYHILTQKQTAKQSPSQIQSTTVDYPLYHDHLVEHHYLNIDSRNRPNFRKNSVRFGNPVIFRKFGSVRFGRKNYRISEFFDKKWPIYGLFST